RKPVEAIAVARAFQSTRWPLKRAIKASRFRTNQALALDGDARNSPASSIASRSGLSDMGRRIRDSRESSQGELADGEITVYAPVYGQYKDYDRTEIFVTIVGPWAYQGIAKRQ